MSDNQKDHAAEVEFKDPDGETDVDNVVLDPKKERKLLIKLDVAFIPIIMLTYLSCFLDRTNIGWFCPWLNAQC